MKSLLKALSRKASKRWFTLHQVGDDQFILTFTRPGFELLRYTQPESSRKILADEADKAALFNVLHDALSRAAWEKDTFPAKRDGDDNTDEDLPYPYYGA